MFCLWKERVSEQERSCSVGMISYDIVMLMVHLCDSLKQQAAPWIDIPELDYCTINLQRGAP